MSKTYFIKLKPLSTFFFGGEKNFGADDAAPVNYLVRSRFLPQQTSVLGLIRYHLLIQDKGVFDGLEMKITDASGAEKLIGKQGFRVDAQPPFGVIEQISPLQIYKGEEMLYPICMGAGYGLSYQTEGKSQLQSGQELGHAPLLRDANGKAFLAKQGFSDRRLMSQSGKIYEFVKEGSMQDKKSGIFVEHKQVGILKNKRADSDEDDAFYKQFSYRMNSGFAFGFYLQLKEDLLETGNHTVPFGGEGSLFRMEIKTVDGQQNESIPQAALPFDKLSKLVLLSDSFVSLKEIAPLLDFMMADTRAFRFLKSSIDTRDFVSLSADKNKNSLQRSQKYRLLKRGAVLYPKAGAMAKLQQALLQEPFHSIGFNHFQAY